MTRGRNGPRQPGGGRQQAGPRHQPRGGTRASARFSKGEGRFGEGEKRFGQGEGRFAEGGKRFGGGGKRFDRGEGRSAEGGKRFEANDTRKGEGRFEEGGKRFGRGERRFAEGGKRFGNAEGRFAEKRFEEGGRRSDKGEARFAEGGKRFGKGERRFEEGGRRFNKDEGRSAEGGKRFEARGQRFGRGEGRFENNGRRFDKGERPRAPRSEAEPHRASPSPVVRGERRFQDGGKRFGGGEGRSAEGGKRFAKGEGRFAGGGKRFGEGKRFGGGEGRSAEGEKRFSKGEGRFTEKRFEGGGRRFDKGERFAEGGKRFDKGGKPFDKGEGRFAGGGKRFDKGEGRFAGGGTRFGNDEGRAPVATPTSARETTPAEGKPAESAGVQTLTVMADESGMRVDRFFEARFPGLSFSHIQRIVRKGEVRVNGRRTETKARLEAQDSVRVPPLSLEAPPPREDAPQAQKDRAFLKSITLYEDDDVLVLNKPMGLAVQGGSGTTRHVDGMLGSLRGSHPDAQRPRLVHRLDKDTAGCLLVAKTRFAAAALSKTFRSRSARKIYWALVAGVPRPHQGRISTYLAKQEEEEDSYMRIAQHGEKDAVHAVTYYAVIETSAQKLAWVSLKPVTGRTHQLRAHMTHGGHPIVGDPKYFTIENWELPGGIQNRLHLLARRIVVPHPRGGQIIDVSAPLPPHMEQTWNLLGFDATRYDPIVEAPEE